MSCNQTIHPDSTAFLSGTSRISHVSVNEKCPVKFTPSHGFWQKHTKTYIPKVWHGASEKGPFKWKVAFQSSFVRGYAEFSGVYLLICILASVSLIQYNSNHLAKTTPLGAGWQLIVLSFKGVSWTQNSALHARLEERGTKSSPKKRRTKLAWNNPWSLGFFFGH